MEDLLQSQISESCKLALPNGLTELMTDISREVLRAQPENLLQFITDYLSSMLVTRENLYIATQVCGTVCDCSCRPELEDELRFLGLDEASAKEAAGIIEEYFGQGNVKEEDLVLKLIKKTTLNEDNLPDVLAAIRSAFLRHQSNKPHIDFESPPGSDDDQTEKAVKHTLALYKKTDPGYRFYSIMATKIQAAYRAYRVKRLVSSDIKLIEGTKSIERSRVRFDTIADEIAFAEQESEPESMEEVPSGRFNELAMNRLSSTSLAGSYINLPEHRPYSIRDVESYEECEEEKPEKERNNYFYTREEATEEECRKEREEEVPVSTSDKRIPFYTYPADELIEESESESIGESDDNDVIAENIEENIEDVKVEEEVKEGITEEIDIPRKGSDEKCTEEKSLELEKYEEEPIEQEKYEEKEPLEQENNEEEEPLELKNNKEEPLELENNGEEPLELENNKEKPLELENNGEEPLELENNEEEPLELEKNGEEEPLELEKYEEEPDIFEKEDQ